MISKAQLAPVSHPAPLMAPPADAASDAAAFADVLTLLGPNPVTAPPVAVPAGMAIPRLASLRAPQPEPATPKADAAVPAAHHRPSGHARLQAAHLGMVQVPAHSPLPGQDTTPVAGPASAPDPVQVSDPPVPASAETEGSAPQTLAIPPPPWPMPAPPQSPLPPPAHAAATPAAPPESRPALAVQAAAAADTAILHGQTQTQAPAGADLSAAAPAVRPASSPSPPGAAPGPAAVTTPPGQRAAEAPPSAKPGRTDGPVAIVPASPERSDAAQPVLAAQASPRARPTEGAAPRKTAPLPAPFPPTNAMQSGTTPVPQPRAKVQALAPQPTRHADPTRTAAPSLRGQAPVAQGAAAPRPTLPEAAPPLASNGPAAPSGVNPGPKTAQPGSGEAHPASPMRSPLSVPAALQALPKPALPADAATPTAPPVQEVATPGGPHAVSQVRPPITAAPVPDDPAAAVDRLPSAADSTVLPAKASASYSKLTPLQAFSRFQTLLEQSPAAPHPVLPDLARSKDAAPAKTVAPPPADPATPQVPRAERGPALKAARSDLVPVPAEGALSPPPMDLGPAAKADRTPPAPIPARPPLAVRQPAAARPATPSPLPQPRVSGPAVIAVGRAPPTPLEPKPSFPPTTVPRAFASVDPLPPPPASGVVQPDSRLPKPSRPSQSSQPDIRQGAPLPDLPPPSQVAPAANLPPAATRLPVSAMPLAVPVAPQPGGLHTSQTAPPPRIEPANPPRRAVALRTERPVATPTTLPRIGQAPRHAATLAPVPVDPARPDPARPDFARPDFAAPSPLGPPPPNQAAPSVPVAPPQPAHPAPPSSAAEPRHGTPSPDTGHHALPRGFSTSLAHAVVDSGHSRAEVILDPAELGRLRFDMVTKGDQVQVTLTAERPETLDLLRRNADELRQEFRSSGLETGNLNFSQWGSRDGAPTAGDPKGQTVAPEDPAPLIPMALSAPRLPVSGAGLDLRL